jgi:hypothetical protein
MQRFAGFCDLLFDQNLLLFQLSDTLLIGRDHAARVRVDDPVEHRLDLPINLLEVALKRFGGPA